SAAGVILDRIQSKLGGAAEGAHSGLSGAMHNLSASWEDLMSAMENSPGLRLLSSTLEVMATLVKASTPTSVIPGPGGGRAGGFGSPGVNGVFNAGDSPAYQQFLAQFMQQYQGQREGQDLSDLVPIPELRPDDLDDQYLAKEYDDEQKAAKAVQDYINN